MLKYILVLALAVASALGASAQAASDTHLVGHVVDKETGEHLPFYIIKLSGASKAGTMSDASGHYTFRHLAPGKYTVEASYTGYKTQTRHIDLKAGTTAIRARR